MSSHVDRLCASGALAFKFPQDLDICFIRSRPLLGLVIWIIWLESDYDTACSAGFGVVTKIWSNSVTVAGNAVLEGRPVTYNQISDLQTAMQTRAGPTSLIGFRFLFPNKCSQLCPADFSHYPLKPI